MDFYWPLIKLGCQITLNWMAEYSLGTRALFGILFGLVSLGTLRAIFFGDTTVSMFKRIIRIAVELVFGPAAVIIMLFIISVVYYAPSALLQETATNAANEARTNANTEYGKQLAEDHSRFEACGAGYNRLLNTLRFPYPNPKNSDLEAIIRERQLLLDARTKNDPTAYPLHMALESDFGIYLRKHPDPCEEK